MPRDDCCVAFVHYIFINEHIETYVHLVISIVVGVDEMKKLKWGVLLFLILVFVLSSWPSFLAFNQAEQVATEQDVKKMAVALVNEDKGAVFNDEQLDFGREFVRSIEKDSTHNWFIVSRGVAENGIEQNLYNMMIVIPHDFTEKALAIDSDSPEKVQINYKINASESNEVRSKAKETASAILNDFNRRIIDVYFASVIGNLQDAQDNIQEIVEKEAHYTNTYNQNVNNQLADYTSQFSIVQDNSQISRDSFNNFKDILNMFEENLYEGVNSNQKYVSNFSDMLDTHQEHHNFTQSVYSDLNSLRNNMHHDDVMEQLDHLEKSTARIHRQFQEPEEERPPTILMRAAGVQNAFNEAVKKVERVEKHLDDLVADKNKELREKLEEVFDGEFYDIFKGKGIYREPNRAVLNKIHEEIAKLPTLAETELVELEFESDREPNTTTRLTNVIQVTNKLLDDEEFAREEKPVNDGQIPLAKLVEEIKAELSETGVTGIDTVQLPLQNAEGKEFTKFELTNLPEQFSVAKIKLTMSGWSEEINEYQPGQIIDIEDKQGDLTVEVTMKLNSDTNDIDIFEPVSWQWKIHEKHRTGQEIQDSEQPNPDNGEGEGTDDSADSDDAGEQTDDGEGNSVSDENHGEETEEPEQPSEPIVTEIQIENNYAAHTVQTSLLENKKGRFINEAAETVASYERLYSLYELYFGFNMNQLPEGFSSHSLGELAEEDSLYYLFNKTNMVDVIVDSIIGSITENTAKLVERVNSKIANFKNELNDARRNANRMVETIDRTKAHAEILNENVGQTLADLAKWREASLHLVAGQEQVLLNEEEEMATIVGLDQEFKAFLAQSQSLAEQANSNLSSADHVYDTLETIDNHAKEIQESGAAIVTNADTLSKQLVEKINNDQNFADNFVNVLANSRIGDRPNEDLYSFLSEPVKVKNDGIIMAGDALTPYFLVLICFIVALFTAYVISTYDERRQQKATFKEDMPLMKRNFPITVIAVGIGIVEGLVICIISGYLLQISQTNLIQWIGLNVLIMVTLLLVSTYLLRQLKMVGMFILLMMLSLYLLLTNALTSDGEGKFSLLKQISPLQHVEMMLAKFMQASGGYSSVVISLAGLLVLSLVANLYVIHRSKEKEVESNEGMPEAN